MKMNLKYQHNKQIIGSLYNHLGLANAFKKENSYLESAFQEINSVWFQNFNKMEKVNYLLIAEAPLWGNNKKYIYNSNTNNTQFFYRSDLEKTLDIQIKDKKEFLNVCQDIGFLMIDISPFPLNALDTSINYGQNTPESKKLTNKEYQELVKLTLPTFFNEKIKLISKKKSDRLQVFFRYARVKHAFQSIISDLLIQHGLIQSAEDISDIAQSGGGIDRKKLKNILLNN